MAVSSSKETNSIDSPARVMTSLRVMGHPRTWTWRPTWSARSDARTMRWGRLRMVEAYKASGWTDRMNPRASISCSHLRRGDRSGRGGTRMVRRGNKRLPRSSLWGVAGGMDVDLSARPWLEQSPLEGGRGGVQLESGAHPPESPLKGGLSRSRNLKFMRMRAGAVFKLKRRLSQDSTNQRSCGRLSRRCIPSASRAPLFTSRGASEGWISTRPRKSSREAKVPFRERSSSNASRESRRICCSC